jgi:transposase
MTSNLKYTKNYTEFGEPYQLFLPLNLEGLVPDDDSVRLLSHELEELDYTLLYQAYSAKGRNPAVDPKTMFKILTYAYSRNIYSSRRIETACRRDINFMWLLAGQKAPDHSTIARFHTGFLTDACESLFYQMVRRLAQADELSKETVFIDGTKLEACANKYTFVWKKSVGKWEEKMFQKMQDAVQLLNHENPRPMRNGKSTALKRISANAKTWDMMKNGYIHLPCREIIVPSFYQKAEKQERL